MSRGKGMNLSPEFGFFIGSWQPYFAWTQTRLYDGSRVWLRTVYRRRVQGTTTSLAARMLGGSTRAKATWGCL